MSNNSDQKKQFFEFSDEQRISWLRLYRSQNVGPKTFRDLVSHFGTAANALDAIPDIANRGGAVSKIRICSRQEAETELVRASQTGARYIAMGEPEFPPLLRQTENGPPLICCMGDTSLFKKPSLAIVGSRNASIAGLKLAERFASELGEKNYAIVSGLARGIDSAAHRASLRTGTIAVFAGGIDAIYPSENKSLAAEIVDNNGILVTEMPMGHQPVAKDFPRRNRIVTGLSSGVLIVEAAKRSGSLITARIANETGRIVMAVPGSPLDPRSSGTNGLIRDGATLVTSSEDILEALSPLHPDQQEFVYDISEDDPFEALEGKTDPQNLVEPTQKTRERILAAISSTPVEVDDVIRFCEADPGEVQLVLLELSLAGRLERHNGNRVSII